MPAITPHTVMIQHMTLGELAGSLEYVNPNAKVYTDFGARVESRIVGPFESYRGYYEDLAIGYSGIGASLQASAGSLLRAAQKIMNGGFSSTFTGYKGGEFAMNADTPIWISNYGEASGYALVDIVAEGMDGNEYAVLLRGYYDNRGW